MKKAATILIIDDSPEDRHTYKAFLSQHDDCLYTFLEADDADEGLRIHSQARVDLILLDYQLPDLSGIDVLERLRDTRGRVAVPVVMTTGRGSEQVAVQALKAGAVDYLVKAAVTSANLYRATRNALERGRLADELSRETADREHAEQELRDSEARFRLLVESVQDHAILMLDREGRIDSWNAGARAMFGYHDREIIGQHYRRLFTPDDARARIPERELEESRGLSRSTDERWHVHKNGKRVWTLGSVSPVLDPSGVHRGYAKVLRDVTERRETALRLQEALEVRDEFLAVASHELRTPTTALTLQIQGLLRQLERADGQGVQPERVKASLRDAGVQVERLHDVLENLLEAASSSVRQAPLTLRPVELGAVIADVVQALPDAERPSIVVERSDPIQGTWDRGRLEQVLRRILSAARKQSAGGDVRVRLAHTGGSARVTIGPATVAPVAELEDDRVVPTDIASLGLGVYVSRHILQALGGVMHVHRDTSGGTTFAIELATGEQSDRTSRTSGV